MTPNANAPLPRGERIERWLCIDSIGVRGGAMRQTQKMAEQIRLEWDADYPADAPHRVVRLVELRDGESITAPASPDDERERFEAWTKENGWNIQRFSGKVFHNEYLVDMVQAMWVGWQAARQQPNGEGRANA